MTHTHRGGCTNPQAHTHRPADMTVDTMAVVRLLERFPIEPTMGERIEAVRVMTARGHSADYIADWLHVTERTISRYRAALKETTCA